MILSPNRSRLAQFVIKGVDGSHWVIHGPGSESSPVQLEQSSVGELYDSPVATSYRARVGQPGAMYMGMRYPERHITLNLTSFSENVVDWVRTDSELRKAFTYDQDALLIVNTETSGSRHLKVRLEREPEYRQDLDAHALQVARWEFSLIAPDPFWVSEEFTDEFYFDGLNWDGGGVTVTNPGDVQAWPKWVLTAPAKFILPDKDFRDPKDDRQVVLPFQPIRRTVLVDTDPGEEMIVANDDTLLWAQMSGQFFMNPIPPRTPETFLPVSVDPLPLLPFVIPDSWRRWLSARFAEWATALGIDRFLSLTPEDVGRKVREFMSMATPDWVEDLTPDILEEITAQIITDAIVNTWGNLGNMAGATAQIRYDVRWSRPWGLE